MKSIVTIGLALLQVLAGAAAIFLIILLYQRFSPRVRVTLLELDKIAGGAEREVDTTIAILGTVQDIAERLRNAGRTHRETITAAIASATTASDAMRKWGSSLSGIAETSTKVAGTCDDLGKVLPPKLPWPKVKKETVKIAVPGVNPQTVAVPVSYTLPKFDTRTLTVLTSIDQSPGGFHRRIANIGVDLDFVHTMTPHDHPIEYLVRLPGTTSETTSVSASIPAIPPQSVSIEVPTSIDMEEKDYFQEEKKLLDTLSLSLRAAAEDLKATKVALESLADTVGNQGVKSLKATKEDIEIAEQDLGDLAGKRIPCVIGELREQKSALNQSRDLFSVLQGALIPSTVVCTLVPIGIVLNGLIMLFAAIAGARHRSDIPA